MGSLVERLGLLLAHAQEFVPGVLGPILGEDMSFEFLSEFVLGKGADAGAVARDPVTEEGIL